MKYFSLVEFPSASAERRREWRFLFISASWRGIQLIPAKYFLQYLFNFSIMDPNQVNLTRFNFCETFPIFNFLNCHLYVPTNVVNLLSMAFSPPWACWMLDPIWIFPLLCLVLLGIQWWLVFLVAELIARTDGRNVKWKLMFNPVRSELTTGRLWRIFKWSLVELYLAEWNENLPAFHLTTSFWCTMYEIRVPLAFQIWKAFIESLLPFDSYDPSLTCSHLWKIMPTRRLVSFMFFLRYGYVTMILIDFICKWPELPAILMIVVLFDRLEHWLFTYFPLSFSIVLLSFSWWLFSLLLSIFGW